MKRLSVIAVLALIGKPAFAAPPAPAPVYSWTGFYVGGNVGYGWGDAGTNIAGSASTIALPTIGGGFPGNNVAFADSGTERLKGVIGGGQFGYNLQFSRRWLLGFEADIQGSGERGSNAFADSFSATVCNSGVFPPGPTCLNTGTLNATAATAYDAKISWFGTLRGRLGFLIGDQALFYGTGGLAYGRVELSGITNVGGSEVTGGLPPIVALTPAATAFSESKINLGFVVGGGMEGTLSYWLPPNWTWKLEYLYLDLGSLNTAAPFPGAFVVLPGGGAGTSPFTGAITTHTHFTDNIVRFGVNYRFD
jgi:outer membrane immunogenic protein